MMQLRPIPHHLAPTVGPKVSGVTFEAGVLGGIGETIAVGQAIRFNNAIYVAGDSTWTPANDSLVSSCTVPIGSLEIFIGFTPEAYGYPRDRALRAPTRHPIIIDTEDGSESSFSQ